MSLADEIQDHEVRCQPHLLTLRLLARCEHGELGEPMAEPPRPPATEVAQATGAVLAEVKAAHSAVSESPGTETLLEARLNRLASAAGDALAATLAGNLAEMRRQLDRFDALTSAMWTVQRALYGQGVQNAR